MPDLRRRLWERRLRHGLADTLFYVQALRVLAGPFVAFVVVAALGTALHRAYGSPPSGLPPGWAEAAYVSVNLMLVEHVVETPDLPPHPIGLALQYLLPIAGVFLVAEGVLKLGITVFRKEENQERWMEILASTSRGHIILCGLGTVGFRVLEELVAIREQVFAIEKDGQSPLLEQARALGAHVHIGDARAENLLRRLNVQGAAAVIVATDDDLANLEIAMDVREMASGVPIVLRLFDQRLAQKVRQTLGIEVSYSTSKLAAPLFAAAAVDRSVVGVHRLGDRSLLVLEIEVKEGGALCGATVSELVGTHRISVVAHRTAAGTWEAQPAAGTRLQAGDRVQLMVASDRVRAVHRLNGGGLSP